jgi:hypothetical protein
VAANTVCAPGMVSIFPWAAHGWQASRIVWE